MRKANQSKPADENRRSCPTALRRGAGRLDATPVASSADGPHRLRWHTELVFSVERAFVRDCPVPTFLLPGTDIPHPAATSAELIALLPGAEVLTHWRGPEYLSQQETRVVAFLRRHMPSS